MSYIIIYYNIEYQEGEPDKEYCDGLKDRISIRLAMILQIYDGEDDSIKEKNEKKAIYLGTNKEIYEESEDARNHYKEELKKISELNDEKENLIKEYKALEKDAGNDQKHSEIIQRKQRRISDKIEKIEKYKEKKLEKNFDNDYMIHILENISKQEGEFYQLLLDLIPANSNSRSIYQCLKRGEWWRLKIEDRITILENLSILMEDRKWYFLRERYDEIAEKLIHPHEYGLLKATMRLIDEINEERHSLYSYGEEDMFCRANKGDEEVSLTQDVALRIPEIELQAQCVNEFVTYRYNLDSGDACDEERADLGCPNLDSGDACDEEQTNLGCYNLDDGDPCGERWITLKYNQMMEEHFEGVEGIIRQINKYTSDMKNSRNEKADVTNFQREMVCLMSKAVAELYKVEVTEEDAKSILEQIRNYWV